jgi:hypothetical protein
MKRLKQVLVKYRSKKMALIGRMLIDEKPSELHYFDDSKIYYPDLVPGNNFGIFEACTIEYNSQYHNKLSSFNMKWIKNILVKYCSKKMALVGRMLINEKPSELHYFDDSKIFYPDLVPGNNFGIF